MKKKLYSNKIRKPTKNEVGKYKLWICLAGIQQRLDDIEKNTRALLANKKGVN